MDLCFVVPDLTHLRFVNGQLVGLPPFGILTSFCFVYTICLLVSVSTLPPLNKDLFMFVFICLIDLSSLCGLIRSRSLIKISFRESHIVALILLGSSPLFLMTLFVMCVACLVGTAAMIRKKSRDKPAGYTMLLSGEKE